MAHRSDENKKEFSIEELNAWNVEKLRKYLKNRGVVITTDTRKRDLVSKVYHACRLDLPLCSTKEQDDAQIKARRKEKLFIDGISLPLPEELENWVSGSHNFPDMTMNDIELYLSKSNDRKSAKEGKNLYESGHVSEVEFNNISDCLKFCYVRGKVVPQTRIGENPYTVWVCLNTTNGDILTGECGCLAGYGESCKHVSSLLHYIEYEVRVGNNKTCTSNPQQWGRKRSKRKKIHQPDKTKNMKVKKTRAGLQISEEAGRLNRSAFDPRAPGDRFSSFENEDWEKIAVATTGKCSVLCFIKTDYVQVNKRKKAESLDSISFPPTIPEMVEEIKKKMPNASLQEKCIALKEAMQISQEEADLVSKFTREQSEDPKWKEYRIGRITASKAHDVIVKYNADMTVKNEISAENLCAEICGYLPEVKSKSVQWGKQTESVARKTFNKTMKATHKNFACTESGLVISVKSPYIAASPDGYCKCNCCPDTLFECKCPWTHRGKSIPEYVKEKDCCLLTFSSTGGNSSLPGVQLKHNHRYFTQVQHQLFVCEKEEEYFYVYTTKDTFTEKITIDPNYKENLAKFEHFFNNYICTELFEKRILSKVIVRSILKDIINASTCAS